MPKRSFGRAFGRDQQFGSRKKFKRPQVQFQRRRSGLKRRQSFKNMVTSGFLGIEKKFYDTALAATSLVAPTDSAGGEFDPSATSMMTTPTAGDGEQQRDGKQIACLYLDISGAVAMGTVEGAVNPPETIMCYIACVLDTQSNAAQMNSEDCFKNTSAAALGAAQVQRNLLFGKRFRILKQKSFIIAPKTLCITAANLFNHGGANVPFQWFIPLKGMRINFNAGTTASIANVIDNSIHMIAFVSSTDGNPTIRYNARLRFIG